MIAHYHRARLATNVALARGPYTRSRRSRPLRGAVDGEQIRRHAAGRAEAGHADHRRDEQAAPPRAAGVTRERGDLRVVEAAVSLQTIGDTDHVDAPIAAGIAPRSRAQFAGK